MEIGRTVVIRCPNWVGDLVMATPFFEAIGTHYREKVQVIAVCRPYNASILEGNPFIQQIIQGDDRTWRGIWELRQRILKVHPDTVVLLPNSIRSLLPFIGTGYRKMIGYSDQIRRYLLEGPFPNKDNRGKIIPLSTTLYYLQLLPYLGITPPKEWQLKLYTTPKERELALNYLTRIGINPQYPIIAINPGAMFGSSKCWPPEYFAKLIDLLAGQLNVQYLILSGPQEEPIVERIQSLTKTKIFSAIHPIANLSELKGIVEVVDLMITNDTGPRHYAIAYQKPVIVIMGPTDPRWTESSYLKTIIIRKNLPCSPCHLKTCPLQHECMTSIQPEEVFEAVIQLLKKDPDNRIHQSSFRKNVPLSAY